MRPILSVLLIGGACFGCGGGGAEEPSPGPTPPKTRTQVERCRMNLTALVKLMSEYRSRFGGERREFPFETGSNFWLKLQLTDPPLVDAALSDVFYCRWPGWSRAGDRTGLVLYCGPVANANVLTETDPMGACLDQHEDGTALVVLKNGEVILMARDDPKLAGIRDSVVR